MIHLDVYLTKSKVALKAVCGMAGMQVQLPNNTWHSEGSASAELGYGWLLSFLAEQASLLWALVDVASTVSLCGYNWNCIAVAWDNHLKNQVPWTSREFQTVASKQRWLLLCLSVFACPVQLGKLILFLLPRSMTRVLSLLICQCVLLRCSVSSSEGSKKKMII